MNFGSHLREARERRGVSLRQIATATRISVRTLEALENNEIGKLPGGIFSRGFVRSYAHEVGLDPDEAVREFVHQFPLDHVRAGSPAAVEDDVARGEEALRKRQQFGVLVAVAIAVPIGAAMLYLLLSARRPASAAAEAGDASALADSPPGVSASAPPAAVPLPAGVSRTAAGDGRGAGGAVGAVGAGGALAGAAAKTSGGPLPTASDGTLAAALVNPNESLQLRVAPDGPCWVRVTVEGSVRHEALMQKGEVFTVDARSGFDILVGDAGAFRFSINGRPGRGLGGSGEVVSARITRATVQNWLQATRH